MAVNAREAGTLTGGEMVDEAFKQVAVMRMLVSDSDVGRAGRKPHRRTSIVCCFGARVEVGIEG